MQIAWIDAAVDESERKARERTARWSDVVAEAEAERRDIEAHDAVRSGVPLYVDLLRSPDPAVQLYAADLLAWFPEEHSLIASAVTRVIAVEPASVAMALL